METFHWQLENSESKTIDSAIASFMYKNTLTFNVADSQSLAAFISNITSPFAEEDLCS